ncbi:MAG TPA: E2/UBC family protein [Longimicrobiaceae bacterium]|nr:E2/UBC family protein [Longimicrobiaceae bacterium]
MYGPERLLRDLGEIGYEVERVTGADGNVYAVIRGFVVPVGRFADRVIDLGLLAPPDYPRNVGSSIHVRATPQLLEYGSVPGVRNIIQSGLGPEWRYWSHNFGWGAGERSTRRLLSQINRIFAHA